jgi:hypothetical protein
MKEQLLLYPEQCKDLFYAFPPCYCMLWLYTIQTNISRISRSHGGCYELGLLGI